MSFPSFAWRMRISSTNMRCINGRHTSCKKERPHRTGLTYAVRMNWWWNILNNSVKRFTQVWRRLPASTKYPSNLWADRMVEMNVIRTVSYIAKPAVTLPPGEFMYRWIGFDVSSASRNKSWATRRAESVSLIFDSFVKHGFQMYRSYVFTGPYSIITRSLRRREKMSYDRSPRPC